MLLSEAGFNGEWIEQSLAHEEGVNLAFCLQQGRVCRAVVSHVSRVREAWGDGRTHVPKLVPENVSVPVLSPAL